MSTIDTYGELELPEERSRIEIVENPFNAICTAYDLFKEIVQKQAKELLGNCKPSDELKDKIDSLYQSAVAILAEKSKLIYKKEDLLEFFNVLGKIQGNKYHCYYSTGLFVSALQNTSNLDSHIIDGEFPLKFYCIGYRLQPNKKLVVNEDIECYDLGKLCDGGIVINKGYVKNFGSFTNKGLIINENYAEVIGHGMNEGIAINKKTTCNLGNMIKHGICINKDNTSYIGHNSINGILINNGNVSELFANSHSKGIHINKGEVNFFGDYNKQGVLIDLGTSREPRAVINLKKNHILKKLVSKLNQKLAELDPITKICEETSDEEAFKLVNNFDTVKFEQEVKDICTEIKEKYEVITKRLF